MPRKKASPKDPVRSWLATCLSKAMAYRAVGNMEQAKHWAGELVKQLKVSGLI